MDLSETEDHCDSDRDYEEFYFESDHLALRGNVDYTTMLRTIAVLQSQRIQVIKDIDILANAEKNALEKPEEFLQKIAKGEMDSLPGPINIIDVSIIYTVMKRTTIYFLHTHLGSNHQLCQI